MRIAIAATTVAAAGALLFAIPAAAGAATPDIGVNSPFPCGSASGFSQVAAGQSVAQVNSEMGVAGQVVEDNTRGGFEHLQENWRACSTSGGLLTYAISFDRSLIHPLAESSKNTIPTLPLVSL